MAYPFAANLSARFAELPAIDWSKDDSELLPTHTSVVLPNGTLIGSKRSFEDAFGLNINESAVSEIHLEQLERDAQLRQERLYRKRLGARQCRQKRKKDSPKAVKSKSKGKQKAHTSSFRSGATQSQIHATAAERITGHSMPATVMSLFPPVLSHGVGVAMNSSPRTLATVHPFIRTPLVVSSSSSSSSLAAIPTITVKMTSSSSVPSATVCSKTETDTIGSGTVVRSSSSSSKPMAVEKTAVKSEAITAHSLGWLLANLTANRENVGLWNDMISPRGVDLNDAQLATLDSSVKAELVEIHAKTKSVMQKLSDLLSEKQMEALHSFSRGVFEDKKL